MVDSIEWFELIVFFEATECLDSIDWCDATESLDPMELDPMEFFVLAEFLDPVEVLESTDASLGDFLPLLSLNVANVAKSCSSRNLSL